MKPVILRCHWRPPKCEVVYGNKKRLPFSYFSLWKCSWTDLIHFGIRPSWVPQSSASTTSLLASYLMTVLKKPLKFPLVVQFFQPLLGQLSVLVSPERRRNRQFSFTLTKNEQNHNTSRCVRIYLCLSLRFVAEISDNWNKFSDRIRFGQKFPTYKQTRYHLYLYQKVP